MDLLKKLEDLEQRSRQFGFYWSDTSQIMHQILSECDEIQQHLSLNEHGNELQAEVGDLLHAAFSLCVYLEFNPYTTLERAIQKFERRFERVVSIAQSHGFKHLKGHSFDDLMSFWKEAKTMEERHLSHQLITDSTPPVVANDFVLDERLASSCTVLTDWPLCRVLRKNNSLYPWFILVPRRRDITEIMDLKRAERQQLMDELSALSYRVKRHFSADKINTGALGNIVEQLHIHVIARFKEDPSWPRGVW